MKPSINLENKILSDIHSASMYENSKTDLQFFRTTTEM